MQVALFTDTDFDRPAARRRFARAPGTRPRTFVRASTRSAISRSTSHRRSRRFRLPTSVLRLDPARRAAARAEGVGVIHVAGGGLAVAAGRYLADRGRLPLVGSVWRMLRGGRCDRSSGGSTAVCAWVMVPSAAPRRAAAATRRPGLADADARLAGRHRPDPVLAGAPLEPAPRRLARLGAAARDPRRRVSRPAPGEHPLDRLSAELHRQRRRAPIDRARRRSVARRHPARVLPDVLVPAGCRTIRRDRHGLGGPARYPPARDTGCSALLEAQACGLPALVGDAGSARENVVPGVTGYVCRAGDVRELASRAGGAPDGRGAPCWRWDARRATREDLGGLTRARLSLYREAAGSKLAPRQSATDDARASAARRLPRCCPCPASSPGGRTMTLSVSVVVCAHNEGRYLAACLHSLLAQTRAADEIVVVDNASSDDTGRRGAQSPASGSSASRARGWSSPARPEGAKPGAVSSSTSTPTAARRCSGSNASSGEVRTRSRSPGALGSVSLLRLGLVGARAGSRLRFLARAGDARSGQARPPAGHHLLRRQLRRSRHAPWSASAASTPRSSSTARIRTWAGG